MDQLKINDLNDVEPLFTITNSSFTSPADAVILTMIRGTAPECPVFPVKINCIDGAAGAVVKCKCIAHLPQLFAYKIRRAAVQ